MNDNNAPLKNAVFNLRALAAALQFLTVIPVPVQTGVKDMENSLLWFPVAGMITGTLAAIVFWLAHVLGVPPMMAGLLGVLVLSGSNGFFHLDGVADTADGFFSSRPRRQIMEIMRDSRIGTMGVVGLFFILALKWSALSVIAPEAGWRALVIAAVVARTAQVLAMGLLPYARKEGGLASVFINNIEPLHLAVVSVFGLLCAAVFGGIGGIAALLTAGAAAAGFCAMCMKKIDGITGDTLGALTELVEAVFLCAFSAWYAGVL